MNSSNNGQLAVRKVNVGKGEKWYAVTYMIYSDKDNNLYTIYSNKVSK